MSRDLVLVGRVARAHGNRGQVIVNLETDFPEGRFRVGTVLMVGPEAAPRRIRGVRFHLGRPVLDLEGVDSMNDAEALAGAELKAPAGDAGALPAGTYFHYDLIGCEVVDAAGSLIGQVTAVEGTMERSRLVVASGGGEVLIPLVAEICTTIDTRAKRIVVMPPDGLLDVNAPARR